MDMDKDKLLSHIDHTLLSPTATWRDIQVLCREAVTYKMASVCIPPSFVVQVKKMFGNTVNICTVIGFPLGHSTMQTKIQEAMAAVAGGASEVDMMINLGDVKSGQFSKVTAEITAIKKAIDDKILKVIVETCYLTETEKITLCGCIEMAGADYIKTSTGFGTFGATIEDIKLFKKYLGPDVKVKAAGGIKTLQALEAFIHAGCDRIGTSSAVKILNGG